MAPIAWHPASGADKRTDAINLYNAKDYRGAAALLDDYLVVNNRDPYAAYYAAMANQQTGNVNKARMYYRQVYTLSPNSQIGGFAKNILLKLDPSFAASLPKTTSTGTSSSASSVSSGASSATASAPAFDPSLPGECNIPYDKSNSGLGLDVYLNGRVVRMILDTGAPGICIGKEQMEQIGLKPPTGPADGTTGGSSNDEQVKTWNTTATVRVGQIERRNFPVEVLETNHARPLLGQTFFKDFEYTVDQSAGLIRFRQKAIAMKSTNNSANAVAVPYKFREEGHRIIVTAEVNGKPCPMMFDTGNTSCAVAFSSEKQLTALGIKVPEDAELVTTVGVSGSGVCSRFPINRIKLGPIEKSNVYVNVNHGTLEDREEPLLGEPFISGYEYRIDSEKHLIYFTRR
ncbi:MAG: retroviral-like aspartic protease family protein [Cyanobacteria bacterium SZAS LIN-3]|nr:retroviral-like aspartic protease family protein [Cyanobacteria bacterium SZAS LIN-3]